MGELVQTALYSFVGKLFAVFWLGPTAIIFAAYLVYIVIKNIRELDKWD